MKKLLIPAAALIMALASCGNDSKTTRTCPDVTMKAPDAEVATLRSYLASAGIKAQEDPRGFFYTITKPGGEAKPKSCSNVTVNYSVKLTNGKQVDAGNDVNFNLAGLIPGWQEGIPLVGQEGKIILYMPPFLAYGDQPNGEIPANSILVFNIELKSFN
jgi:FKBP-type peptidyl-prolyl cis-trans isomerase FkpA